MTLTGILNNWNYKGNAGEMWVKVPGGWKDEKTGIIDRYLGANWTGEILIPSKMKEEPE